MRMGFWPGGDRDGNPFVEVDTTLRVADALKSAVLRCYHRDIRAVRRRLTFAGVAPIIAAVEEKLHQSIYGEHGDDRISKNEILQSLTEARDILFEKHSGLFAPLVEDLICKVNLFGLFFASLDIRQESSVHGGILESVASRGEILPADYAALSDEQKIEALFGLGPGVEAGPSEDALLTDTLRTMAAIKTIQQENGPEGCERYIISQCGRALNVVEVYGLFMLAGWRAEELSVDIVPLFETVTDLRNAAKVMRQLYSLPQYRAHLARRGDHQTIMLGFSDGTKDGGYLMANWGIYRAKEDLTKVSEEFGVGVVFFDGRGGPPARGGGKTHKFYSSMGRNIASEAIELTVQGQTVSSNFGTVASARFNIEQLLHAGVQGYIAREANEGTFSPEEESLMEQLADESYRSYEELKNHPAFLDYLLLASPLRYYSETNIGSRPAKRGGSVKLELKDLRAIPFVGAWSQMKQNVPGYYGVGSALRRLHDREGLDGVKEMHRTNLFFRTLMDNCEMAMEKSFFPLTQFLCGDARFGELWRKIFDEFELTREFLLLISGKDSLMSDYPVEKRSIQMRERIMLPLTTIQQYALEKTREQGEPGSPTGISYEKLITRCSFGIINGARNSA
jgi:phosphoenolpyruvate carboxylase